METGVKRISSALRQVVVMISFNSEVTTTRLYELLKLPIPMIPPNIE